MFTPFSRGLHPPDNGQARDGEHQQRFVAIDHLLGQVAQAQGSEGGTPLQWGQAPGRCPIPKAEVPATPCLAHDAPHLSTVSQKSTMISCCL